MKIKVLLVMPGKEAQPIRIHANSRSIKAFVGSNLFRVKLDENTILIMDRDAKIDEFNRIFKGNIILGTFLIVSINKNRKTSMKKRDVRKYTNMFKLRKHQKKINLYKEEFLEEYYSNQKKIKQKKAKQNKQKLFKEAA